MADGGNLLVFFFMGLLTGIGVAMLIWHVKGIRKWIKENYFKEEDGP